MACGVDFLKFLIGEQVLNISGHILEDVVPGRKSVCFEVGGEFYSYHYEFWNFKIPPLHGERQARLQQNFTQEENNRTERRWFKVPR
ncbi:predicted protein [Sclerotinia sclerotiorum 1980 UF-70]|uniref:Uncharacterized protein n=1 Tax=Sclerotinia sclerotiorum (strain ATCC 18683 / 1980 / Ss-1) TaxID=665079 RepID=A7EEV2_SCLS1|nr:predicted protein [Sclerotinia sclerotiorum 1980 UF-70]EDO01368.1 predicted protein [Sclerotinia sclerotiorum 1980 UF-70]